jgi:hypothetical protein
MTISTDLRWRAVTIFYVYGFIAAEIRDLLSLSLRSIYRWIRNFEINGTLEARSSRIVKSRWPEEILSFVSAYVNNHPCFYLDELQMTLNEEFPDLNNVSLSTICRALRFDLNLSRKVLVKHAREACREEIKNYFLKLSGLYFNAHQLVFVDETSKDSRASQRRYGWSKRNTPAIAKVPFTRSSRVSLVAAVDIDGFFAWDYTEGTFDRNAFHKSMINNVLHLMNPFPAPRSILIIDNAKIHCYSELIDAVHAIGAIVLFLPPYCPQLNLIEVCFGLLKKWIQRHANMAFSHHPKGVIDVGLKVCLPKGIHGIFSFCSYGATSLIEDVFNKLTTSDILYFI